MTDPDEETIPLHALEAQTPQEAHQAVALKIPKIRPKKGVHLPAIIAFFIKSRYFFKAIGLGILPAKLLSRLEKNKSTHEEPKIVINTSIWIALGRCSVHILPTAGSIVLYWFNLYGYYIGSELAGLQSWSTDVKLHILQFVSKAHELLIIASIATVVFSIIRHELLFGSGVPLGLIGAGMQFSGISYLW
jgi:hypothetical protein